MLQKSCEMGQRKRSDNMYVGQCTRIWYIQLSHQCADSSEPSLLAYSRYNGCRCSARQKMRLLTQGRIQDFWKGVHIYKGVCVCGGGGSSFADFVSLFLKISHMKMRQFGLTETKLFHFHRLFKNGGGGGGAGTKVRTNPLNLLWIRHCNPTRCVSMCVKTGISINASDKYNEISCTGLFKLLVSLVIVYVFSSFVIRRFFGLVEIVLKKSEYHKSVKQIGSS